jgi:hypothetical protein
MKTIYVDRPNHLKDKTFIYKYKTETNFITHRSVIADDNFLAIGGHFFTSLVETGSFTERS